MAERHAEQALSYDVCKAEPETGKYVHVHTDV